MPNGGSICCFECTYGRNPDERCAIFGTEVTPLLLCRAFRMPRQSHSEARKHWPLLDDLEKGVVYEIDNSYPPTGRPPKPAYRIRRILDQD